MDMAHSATDLLTIAAGAAPLSPINMKPKRGRPRKGPMDDDPLMDESVKGQVRRARKNNLEKQRRNEVNSLFDRLRTVLGRNAKYERLAVLQEAILVVDAAKRGRKLKPTVEPGGVVQPHHPAFVNAAKRVRGDSLQACVAAAMFLSLKDVPNFEELGAQEGPPYTAMSCLQRWLKPHNLAFITIRLDIPRDPDNAPHMFPTLGGAFVILCGKSPREGETSHHVLAQQLASLDDQQNCAKFHIVHDPHRAGEGLLGCPRWVGYFVATNPCVSSLAKLEDHPAATQDTVGSNGKGPARVDDHSITNAASTMTTMVTMAARTTASKRELELPTPPPQPTTAPTTTITTTSAKPTRKRPIPSPPASSSSMDTAEKSDGAAEKGCTSAGDATNSTFTSCSSSRITSATSAGGVNSNNSHTNLSLNEADLSESNEGPAAKKLKSSNAN
jgi:hypothetical protein